MVENRVVLVARSFCWWLTSMRLVTNRVVSPANHNRRGVPHPVRHRRAPEDAEARLWDAPNSKIESDEAIALAAEGLFSSGRKRKSFKIYGITNLEETPYDLSYLGLVQRRCLRSFWRAAEGEDFMRHADRWAEDCRGGESFFAFLRERKEYTCMGE